VERCSRIHASGASYRKRPEITKVKQKRGARRVERDALTVVVMRGGQVSPQIVQDGQIWTANQEEDNN
jgi:hypothetical protein